MTITAETRKKSSAETVAEVALAFASRTAAPPEHSVTISRNAKGVAQFEVTVRGVEAGDCKIVAQRIYDTLAEAYPYQVSTNGGAE